MSDALQPHGLQHARLRWPSSSPDAFSNSCPLNQWCLPTVSSSVIPFSSCPQSFPASGAIQISQFFAWGGQSIGTSAWVLPMKIQDWFPLWLTDLFSLQSKGLLRVFSNTRIQKHQFFSMSHNCHYLFSKLPIEGIPHERCIHTKFWKEDNQVMTNIDSILKSRDITLSTKVHIVRAMVLTLVMYGCESWTIKKVESQRTDS